MAGRTMEVVIEDSKWVERVGQWNWVKIHFRCIKTQLTLFRSVLIFPLWLCLIYSLLSTHHTHRTALRVTEYAEIEAAKEEHTSKIQPIRFSVHLTGLLMPREGSERGK
jgi:hypothetical protein